MLSSIFIVICKLYKTNHSNKRVAEQKRTIKNQRITAKTSNRATKQKGYKEKSKKRGKSNMSKESTQHLKIDYKSPVTLYQFISEGGKINPARITGLSHAQQRKLKNAIKKARSLSLLPSSVRSYDEFHFPEQISAVPFEIDK